MTSLIIKLGAAGDVLRTTPLLRVLDDDVHWLTLPENAPLLRGCGVRVFTSVEALPCGQVYRLVIGLDEEPACLDAVFSRIEAPAVVGAFPDAGGNVLYSEAMAPWFDMSLASRFGRKTADQLKLSNRRSYQDLLFAGLGLSFQGEEYILSSERPASHLYGDIAFAPSVGDRWPMKRWAYFQQAIEHFSRGYRVSVLPRRATLSEHIADIQAHRVIITNDSLPMHIALACGKPCVAFFTCTSPWEIHGYGRLEKVVSPRLAEFYYRRDFDPAASSAIGLSEGVEAIERVMADAMPEEIRRYGS